MRAVIPPLSDGRRSAASASVAREGEAADDRASVRTWLWESIDTGDGDGCVDDLLAGVAAGGDDVLILQLEGRCRVWQGGTALVVDAGDILLLDAASPVRLSPVGRSRHLCLSLPHPPSPDRGRRNRPVAAVRGETGIGTALQGLLLAVHRVAGSLSMSEQRGLRTAIRALVVAAVETRPLHPTDRVGEVPPPRLPPGLQATIETRLADPGLCPAQVAAVHGISIRQLHRRFREAGTSFSAFVRQRRLEHCRDDLADPRWRRLPMTEIAFRWGFSDSAHFSRCFRAAFGCTARDFRAGRHTAPEAGASSAG